MSEGSEPNTNRSAQARTEVKLQPGYSEEDAILQAKLSLLDAHKHAKNTMDLVLITREWMALAICIREGKSDPPTWKEG